MSEALLWVSRNGGIDVDKDYPYRTETYHYNEEGTCDGMKENELKVTIDGMQEGVHPTSGATT